MNSHPQASLRCAYPLQGASALGELRPDTDSPCGLSVPAEGLRTPAAGGPARPE